MSVPNIKSNFTCHEARLFENIKGRILYNTFLRYVHNKLHYKFYPIYRWNSSMIFQRLERARLTDENYNVLICEKPFKEKLPQL